MNVIGLDVSTKTGLARADGSTLRIQLRTPAGDKARRLHELTSTLFGDLRRWPPSPDLAVLEGASLGGPGVHSKLVLAELRAVVLERLFALDVPVVEVKPSALKRYATGNGGADKAAMIAAAGHEGARCATDDEADAWWCRHLGLFANGEISATVITDRDQARHLTGARLDVAASLTWPTTRPGSPGATMNPRP